MEMYAFHATPPPSKAGRHEDLPKLHLREKIARPMAEPNENSTYCAYRGGL